MQKQTQYRFGAVGLLSVFLLLFVQLHWHSRMHAHSAEKSDHTQPNTHATIQEVACKLCDFQLQSDIPTPLTHIGCIKVLIPNVFKLAVIACVPESAFNSFTHRGPPTSGDTQE